MKTIRELDDQIREIDDQIRQLEQVRASAQLELLEVYRSKKVTAAHRQTDEGLITARFNPINEKWNASFRYDSGIICGEMSEFDSAREALDNMDEVIHGLR
jgi:hypothetical protein